MQVKLNLSGHQNAALDTQGFIFPGTVQVNPTAPLQETAEKYRDFLIGLGVGSGDHVMCALPGMSTLAGVAITAIHGLTGQFPSIVALVRQSDGSFAPTEDSVLDLQIFRNDSARIKRENVISL